MSLLQEFLQDADKTGYAIPAFNFSDSWELLAIIETALEEKSPVMVASAEPVARLYSPICLAGLYTGILQKTKAPIFLHLDHSTDTDLCIEAAKAGYPSVMIDASLLDFEPNIEKTKVVTDAVLGCDTLVEAEIGRIGGRNDETTSAGTVYLADTDEAVEFAERTHVDTLAVGLGNAHGFYKGKPQLNFDRLSEINGRINIPLVLHGGTGIAEEDIRKAIRSGINKVNVGTDLHYSYLITVSDYQCPGKSNVNILNAMKPVKEAIKETVRRWIHVCMSENRY